MSPRTRKQYEDIRQEKKQLIMNTALELFANKGYENTSVKDITKAAGIAKGLLYNYFQSKEELLETILNQGIDDLLSNFDLNKDGVLESYELETYIEKSFKMLDENRTFWKLFYSVSLQSSVFRLIEKRIDEIYEPIMKIMVNYFSSAGYENPYMETVFFQSLLDGISFAYVLKPDIYPFEAIKKELIMRYCKPKNS
jgi:AcrR family transcriptional regulator